MTLEGTYTVPEDAASFNVIGDFVTGVAAEPESVGVIGETVSFMHDVANASTDTSNTVSTRRRINGVFEFKLKVFGPFYEIRRF